MKCPNGHENPAGTEFCLECGLEIDTTYVDNNKDEVRNESQQNKQNNNKQQYEDKYSQAKTKTNSNAKDNSHLSDTIKVSLLNDNEEIVKTWTLSKFPSYSVGRISTKGGVDIDLSDFEGTSSVSRMHGKFYKKNSGWIFVDNGSKNGSELLNNDIREQLAANKEYPIKPNDVIALAGRTKLLITKE